MRVWTKAAAEPWAITSDALTTILEIAARKNENPEAVAAKLGRELQNSHSTELRDGVAILPVIGPLFRYANMFAKVSGATSYDILAKDFTTALENPEVRAIILNIDSPGGEINGCAELAAMIYEARGTKPIVAYASGEAASAAYWIASATDEIVVSKTSYLGSIGVVAVCRCEKDETTIEIVSSQSPHKCLDPATDDGRARLQKRIDDLADVFIEAVATYRGVSPGDVRTHYGSGDVFIGDAAVKNGLADRSGSFEKLISELSHEPSPHSFTTDQKDTSMLTVQSLREEHPDVAKALESDAQGQGKKDERTRVQAILTHKEAEQRLALAHHLAFATDMDADTVISALSKAAVETPSRDEVSGFQAAMNGMPNPDVSPDLEPENDSEEALAQRLASY